MAAMEKHRPYKAYSEWLQKTETVENTVEGVIINVGKSLGAAATNYPVRQKDSKQHTQPTERQQIAGNAFAGKGTNVEIRDRYILESSYKVPADKWRKVSGIAYIIVD